ncbi:MAG: hypothetical protein LBK99_01780 [Opitutaceae bacterium]|nr:hypothetical protein [Opitutaceae bacterium]
MTRYSRRSHSVSNIRNMDTIPDAGQKPASANTATATTGEIFDRSPGKAGIACHWAKTILVATLAAFVPAGLFAINYTDTQTASGSTLTLQAGDTVSVAGARALYANSGGSIVVNPVGDVGGITVSSTATSVATVQLGGDGSSMDLGNGSLINTNYRGVVGSANTSFTATALQVVGGSEASPISFSGTVRGLHATGDDGQMYLGSNTRVTLYADSMATPVGMQAGNSSTVEATDSLKVTIIENREGPRMESYAITATSGGTLNTGTNTRLRHLAGTGAYAGSGGTISIGAGALVEAWFALWASGGQISTADGEFRGVGEGGTGVNVGNGGMVTTSKSDIYGELNAIQIQNSTDNSPDVSAPGAITISGGTLRSHAGALISSSIRTGANATNMTVTIRDGAQGASDTGIFYESLAAENIGSVAEIYVEGAKTRVSGAFRGGENVASTFSITDATWTSQGASAMDTLILDNANLAFTLDAIGDAITASSLTLKGASDVTVDFNNAFLAQVVAEHAGTLENFDVAALISGSTIGEGDSTGTLGYTLLTQNADGSTWQAISKGGNLYDIVVLNVVPEPAAVALAGGLLVLAGAFVLRSRQRA